MRNEIPKRYHKGMFLYFRKTIYQIKEIKGKGLLFEVVDVSTGVSSELSRLELSAPNQPHLPLSASTLDQLKEKIKYLKEPQDSPPDADIDPKLLERAKDLIASVKQAQEELEKCRVKAYVDNTKFHQTEELRKITDRLGISVSTFYNRLKKTLEFQNSLPAIAWTFHRNRRSSMGKAQEHFLVTLITSYSTELPATIFIIGNATLERTNGFWIDPDHCEHQVPEKLVAELIDPKMNFDDIRANPDNTGLLAPITPIGRSKFYEFYRAYISQPDIGKEIIDAVSGEGAWDRMFRVFDSFLHLATSPLQYVFADHYLLDVFSVDKKTRRKVKRLWLTVLIDAYTRCILGFVLLYEHPSIESILQALSNAIWPKSNLQEFGIKGLWPCYGIPIQLFLDNAWAHHSYSVESSAKEISHNGEYNSIDLVFRPPYMGRLGALIERFFGTLSLRIRVRLRDHGAIQSSNPRDVRNAAKDACLLYDDIYKFILEEIVRYQNSPHSSLDEMTPNAKWDEAMQSNLPIVPPETEAFKRIFWRKHNTSLKRREKGIPFLGMYYTSRKLGQQPKYDSQTHSENLYTLRFDPLDICNVAVYCNGKFIDIVHPPKLRLPDGSYPKISIAERELARKLAAAEGRKNPGREWLEYIHDLGGTLKERVEEMRATRDADKPKKSKTKTEKTVQPDNTETKPNPTTLNPRPNNGDDYVIVGGSNSDQSLKKWVQKDHVN